MAEIAHVGEPDILIEDETLRAGFTVVPNWLWAQDVSPGAKLSYICLLSYAWREGSCFPGQDRMAKDMKVGVSTLRTYLRELEKADPPLLITKQRGLNRTNLYVLPKIP